MNTTHEPFELMTVEQTAELLGFSPFTVRNWVAQRRIPFLKVAGSVRFERQAVIEWARSERRASRSRHPAYQPLPQLRMPKPCCESTRDWVEYPDGIVIERIVHAVTCERAER